MIIRLSSHSEEASISSPMAHRKVFIQRPGRGRRSAKAGHAAISSQGRLMPIPKATNIPHSTGSGAASAKATAVPRKGAEQGVASKVANVPCQKCPLRPRPLWVANLVLREEDSCKWNRPNRLALNRNVTSTIKPINHGFWN
ncbi:hypothetical protein D3C71_1695140 [compost metagenome]